jgi:hypothetical protein
MYVACKDGMTNHGEGQHLVWARDFILQAGIVDIATGFLVAQNTSPDMNVKVAAGIAYVPNDSFSAYSTEPKYWPVISDAYETIAIASNPSGSSRIDLVCIKCDDGISADENASNIASIVVVQGTPGAGAPSVPANHEKIATITVANGATSIVNANIADDRQQITIGNEKILTDGIYSKSGDDHITIEPGTNKLVKIAVLRQDNETDAYKNNSIILTGWGYKQGDNSGRLAENVAFGVTFSEIPIVISNCCGNKNSAPTALSDLSVANQVAEGVRVASPYAITADQFTVELARQTGNFSSIHYYGYTWIAIGQLA